LGFQSQRRTFGHRTQAKKNWPKQLSSLFPNLKDIYPIFTNKNLLNLGPRAGLIQLAFIAFILSSTTVQIMFRTAIVATTLAAATAISLTPDNWDSETAGKTVFIKFQAPW
jgi:hypothetical protein